MKKHFLLVTWLFLLVFLAAGCSDNNEEIPSTTQPSIEFSNETDLKPTLASGKSTTTLTFTATADWAAQVNGADWLTVSPTQGKAGTIRLQLNASENDSYDERNAAVILTCGNVKETLTVTQKQQDALILTSNKVEMDQNGGTFSIELQSNVSVNYEIASDAQEWITSPSSRGLTASSLNFQVAENPGEDSRQGIITLRGNELTEQVTVYQIGSKPAIILSQKEYLTSSSGGTLQIELKSNTSYQIQLPDADWITQPESRNLSTYTHFFEIAPNETDNTRSAVICFTDTENSIEEKVTVTQVQKDAILIAQNEYAVKAAGDNLEFLLNQNTDFDLSVSANWIRQTSTEKSISFRIDRNDSDKAREATILVTAGNTRQTVRIYQESINREALIAFYQAGHGDQWIRKDNWCSDLPLDQWYGITLNEKKQVEAIELPYNDVSGDLSELLEPLYALPSLKILRLLDNYPITGTIPTSIKNLKAIEELLIESSYLEGSIPEEIGEMTQLTSLYLRGWCNTTVKGLSGNLPASLKNLVNLKGIALSYNYHLTGDISFISSLPNLEVALLHDNQFSGALPEMKGNNWRDFEVQNNRLSGSIPESHGKILEQLDYWGPYNLEYNVSNNQLTGSIPAFIQGHEFFSYWWPQILVQQEGYGLEPIDIPAIKTQVRCYDGSYLNLENTYASHEYTLLLRWDPNCPFSAPYPAKIAALFNKYKDKGLGVAGMTITRYTVQEIKPLTDYLPDAPVFWENYVGNNPANNNNPYNCYNPLFGFNVYPLIYLVDKQGNILFFGGGVAPDDGSIPQYHDNRDDIFKFVANLFGDDDFNPDDNAYYTSSDYSRDGEVITLQKASQGKGIDLVFLGEAFVDKDMGENGLYEQRMKEAMEQYFAFEPYSSFRNRFNVYAVKVVSPNAEFLEESEHRINESADICFEYVDKIPGRNAGQVPMVSVIYNSTYAGRSYTQMFSDGAFVSYMMEGVNDVLNHEAGGHGFGRLQDEYVEEEYENMPLPQAEKEEMDYQWQNWGWGANVDWRNDATTVRWAHFLQDDRYTDEGLGLYEGAYLYGYGAYRPTENSMMRYNNAPFNAPSREQIYKNIMQLSEGSSWIYRYEDFVQYDAINRQTSASSSLHQPATAAQQQKWHKTHRPPVHIKGTWRDAKQSEKVITPLQ